MAKSCKYYKQQREISYDNGVTWIPLDEYQKGALIEVNSSDCTSPSPKIYRWYKADASDYVCVGVDKHYKEYYQESSNNGATWTNVVPTTTRASSDVIEYDSSTCRSKQYLTFVALEDGTFSFSGTSANTVQYSLDSGATWTTLENGASTPTLNIGETVMWKGTMVPVNIEDWEHMPPIIEHGIGTFSSSGRFEVKYNAMSLLYGDDFEGKTDLTGKDCAFMNLFSGCTGLTSAEELILPATTLAESCYAYMFGQCENLTTVPMDLLPATTMAYGCYNYMFSICKSLVILPNLPATTMADWCYGGMFSNCTSITSIPSNYLPATTMAYGCYSYMFYDCSGISTLPSGLLPATTLAENCYANMFLMLSEASSSLLTTVPMDLLPATTLEENCYAHMFSGCRRLTNAPNLPATNAPHACYWSMFEDCRSLTTAPSVLPATVLGSQCYERMFLNCYSLTTAPTISATSFASNAHSSCRSMFGSCSALTTVQSVLLPTNLKSADYDGMFSGCRSLTTAPELPATKLGKWSYRGMFSGCRNLNYIKCLATDISAEDCTLGWVYNVSASGTFVKDSSMSDWSSGDNGIPNNWTIQNA